ncbi:substrate-binding periplasmic protein [Kiloniella sp.]|uniref:substrate-binding periplasmic protein n=1 Tax=Kiloniella sp. TaxID=1938587 RepID=UPI003B01179C
MKSKLLLLLRSSLFGIVFCAFSNFGSFLAQAQTVPSPYDENTPLLIGVYTWAPYTGYELPGHGLLTEVIQVAMERAGITTEVKKVPWSRALKESIRGRIDILPGIWYQEERVEHIAYGSVLAVNRLVLMSRSYRDKRIETLQDLDNLIVGVAQDYAYPKIFVEANNFKRDVSKNLEVILNKLKNDRVDAALADELVARYTSNRLFSNETLFDYSTEALEIKNLFIAISRKTKNYRKILFLFDQALDEMKIDGTYDDLLKKHGLSGDGPS